MASTARVSTRANKDNQGLVKRLNIAVVLLKSSPVVQAISPISVPKKKKGRRSQTMQSLDVVACQAIGVDACVLDFIQPLGLDSRVYSPVAPDSIVFSLAFHIVGLQTLFGESNWSLLPQSPSLDILVFDCVPKSPVPTCIPLLDYVSAFVSFDPVISNCASEVLLTDSDCGSGFDELGIDPGGVTSTKQPYRLLPLDPSLIERVKELKRGKSYKNDNWAINRLNAWRKEVGLDLTPIAEMKYPDLAKVLLEFFLCVYKDSGDRYPS